MLRCVTNYLMTLCDRCNCLQLSFSRRLALMACSAQLARSIHAASEDGPPPILTLLAARDAKVRPAHPELPRPEGPNDEIVCVARSDWRRVSAALQLLDGHLGESGCARNRRDCAVVTWR